MSASNIFSTTVSGALPAAIEVTAAAVLGKVVSKADEYMHNFGGSKDKRSLNTATLLMDVALKGGVFLLSYRAMIEYRDMIRSSDNFLLFAIPYITTSGLDKDIAALSSKLMM